MMSTNWGSHQIIIAIILLVVIIVGVIILTNKKDNSVTPNNNSNNNNNNNSDKRDIKYKYDELFYDVSAYNGSVCINKSDNISVERYNMQSNNLSFLYLIYSNNNTKINIQVNKYNSFEDSKTFHFGYNNEIDDKYEEKIINDNERLYITKNPICDGRSGNYYVYDIKKDNHVISIFSGFTCNNSGDEIINILTTVKNAINKECNNKKIEDITKESELWNGYYAKDFYTIKQISNYQVELDNDSYSLSLTYESDNQEDKRMERIVDQKRVNKKTNENLEFRCDSFNNELPLNCKIKDLNNNKEIVLDVSEISHTHDLTVDDAIKIFNEFLTK